MDLKDAYLTKTEIHTSGFAQVVGPVVPVCWIPVPDIKAVVMLLATNCPPDTCPLSKEQYLTTIAQLNKYISEAEQRLNSGIGETITITRGENRITGENKKYIDIPL